MKRFLTLPAELIFGPLVLGISIELLGFLFLILIGQPAFLLSQRLLLAGGAAALLLPSIFLVMAMCSGYQMTRKLSRGRWAPACWCCYLSEDHVIRYQQGPASRWPLWAYWRARLMALDADFRAPREYGVNYCILDLDKDATLPVK